MSDPSADRTGSSSRAQDGEEMSAEQQVRGVQGWMALDLHSALGRSFDPGADHQGHGSWANWWDSLLAGVKQMKAERDEARAELAKAREAALTLLAKDRDSSGHGRMGYLDEDDLRPLFAALGMDRPAPSDEEAASTVPADAVTALRDAGILACGTNQTSEQPRSCPSCGTSWDADIEACPACQDAKAKP